MGEECNGVNRRAKKKIISFHMYNFFYTDEQILHI